MVNLLDSTFFSQNVTCEFIFDNLFFNKSFEFTLSKERNIIHINEKIERNYMRTMTHIDNFDTNNNDFYRIWNLFE